MKGLLKNKFYLVNYYLKIAITLVMIVGGLLDITGVATSHLHL